MKTKQLLFMLSFLFISTSVQAQFFKKLQKKAENAVERTVLNRTEREVSKKTDATIDDVLQGDSKNDKVKRSDRQSNKNENSQLEEINAEEQVVSGRNAMSMFGGGLEDLPNAYTFKYIMDMKVTSGNEATNFKYYIEPHASYFGMSVPDERTNNMIVYDMENRAMVTFMDGGGKKIAMKIKLPMDEEMQEMIRKGQEGTNEDVDREKVNFKPLPDKVILGYKCKGYLIEHEEGTSKIYMTTEAPVSFLGMFASMDKLPKGSKSANMPFGPNSMLMEMEFTSNKRKKDNTHMICTSIKEQGYTIRTTEYSSM